MDNNLCKEFNKSKKPLDQKNHQNNEDTKFTTSIAQSYNPPHPHLHWRVQNETHRFARLNTHEPPLLGYHRLCHAPTLSYSNPETRPYLGILVVHLGLAKRVYHEDLIGWEEAYAESQYYVGSLENLKSVLFWSWVLEHALNFCRWFSIATRLSEQQPVFPLAL